MLAEVDALLMKRDFTKPRGKWHWCYSREIRLDDL